MLGFALAAWLALAPPTTMVVPALSAAPALDAVMEEVWGDCPPLGAFTLPDSETLPGSRSRPRRLLSR